MKTILSKVFQDWLMLDEYDSWGAWFLIILFFFLSIGMILFAMICLFVYATPAFFLGAALVTASAFLATIGKKSVKQ
jgi:hypothetical protein